MTHFKLDSAPPSSNFTELVKCTAICILTPITRCSVLANKHLLQRDISRAEGLPYCDQLGTAPALGIHMWANMDHYGMKVIYYLPAMLFNDPG